MFWMYRLEPVIGIAYSFELSINILDLDLMIYHLNFSATIIVLEDIDDNSMHLLAGEPPVYEFFDWEATRLNWDILTGWGTMI